MAKLSVTCPGCQRQYQVDDTLLGKRARCRACRTAFVLSRPEEPSGVTSSPWPWI